ncbi:MAG: Acyclic carotenoid 1,2-hydratase [Chlorobi bacterium OLB7]|nr:MAG: Acyclic carotenoid 1,2-hydratase [Chlorobi bacterium OLB7]
MTILPESEDHFHQLSQTGAYEWSYFDGLSDDGEWGFVAIWFRGVPMSPWYSAAADRALRRGEALDPLRHCAFNFSLYHRGRRIYFALHERGGETFRTDYRTADVSFGGNTLYANAIPAGGTFYALSVDTEFPRQASRVVGEIAIRSERQDLSPLLQHQPAPPPDGEEHFWIPAALAGSFTANLGFGGLPVGRGESPLVGGLTTIAISAPRRSITFLEIGCGGVCILGTGRSCISTLRGASRSIGSSVR